MIKLQQPTFIFHNYNFDVQKCTNPFKQQTSHAWYWLGLFKSHGSKIFVFKYMYTVLSCHLNIFVLNWWNICAFLIINQQWGGEDSWNPPMWKARTYLSYIIITMDYFMLVHHKQNSNLVITISANIPDQQWGQRPLVGWYDFFRCESSPICFHCTDCKKTSWQVNASRIIGPIWEELDSPLKGQVVLSVDLSFVVNLNKLLNRQFGFRRSETPRLSCDVTVMTLFQMTHEDLAI